MKFNKKLKYVGLFGILIFISLLFVIPASLAYHKEHENTIGLYSYPLLSTVTLVTNFDYSGTSTGYLTVEDAEVIVNEDSTLFDYHVIVIREGDPVEYQINSRKIKTEVYFSLYIVSIWFLWESNKFLGSYKLTTVVHTEWQFSQYAWQWVVLYTDTYETLL